MSGNPVSQRYPELGPLGLVLIDHGSRRLSSNRLLADMADLVARSSGMAIVETAHMELAEPSIATAFARCVQQGAETVILFPYFLGPGRHWDEDIPRLAAEAAAPFRGVRYLVTAPLGVHALLAEVVAERLAHCLGHAAAGGADCELCRQTGKCQLHRIGEG